VREQFRGSKSVSYWLTARPAEREHPGAQINHPYSKQQSLQKQAKDKIKKQLL